VVQKIAQQHGGTLEIHSELGKGSTFHIRLPKTPV
jgi:signal transduction histidine kinase